MYAIIVQVREHWFVPYEPGTERQCLYERLQEAEKMVAQLKDAKPKAYTKIKICCEE